MANEPALVRRLRSPRRTEQLRAAADLEGLAAVGQAACGRLLEAGCVEPLLGMLRSSSSAVQAGGASALLGLLANSARACDACAAAVPLLVAVLKSGAERVLPPAATALSYLLVQSQERCAAALAADGHTVLLRLCASDSWDVQAAACSGVCELARDAACAAALRDAGALPAMVALLQRPDRASGTASSSSGSSSGSSLAVKAAAARAMFQLCLGESPGPGRHRTVLPEAAVAATAAGAPAALVQLLRGSCDANVLAQAASAVGALANSHDASVLSAVDAAGGLAALAEHMCSGSRGSHTLGVMLHSMNHLLWNSAERCAALAATPGALPRLVQLLDAGAGGGAAQLSAVRALMYLARYTEPAGAAVAAGLVPALAALLGSSSGAAGELPRMACILVGRLAVAGHAAELTAAGVGPAVEQLAASVEPAVAAVAAEALRRLAGDAEPPAANEAAAAPELEPVGLAATEGSIAAAAPAAGQPARQRPRRPRRTCDAAGCNATHGLRLCGGCGTVRYCSEACSRAHWREHRAECRRQQAEKAAEAAAPPADS